MVNNLCSLKISLAEVDIVTSELEPVYVETCSPTHNILFTCQYSSNYDRSQKKISVCVRTCVKLIKSSSRVTLNFSIIWKTSIGNATYVHGSLCLANYVLFNIFMDCTICLMVVMIHWKMI